MATIRKMHRPGQWNPEDEQVELCDHLWLLVDVFDDGSCEEVVTLYFADHAGLEAEWDTGIATTVLVAALSSVLDDAAGDDLTEGQRGAVGQQIELP